MPGPGTIEASAGHITDPDLELRYPDGNIEDSLNRDDESAINVDLIGELPVEELMSAEPRTTNSRIEDGQIIIARADPETGAVSWVPAAEALGGTEWEPALEKLLVGEEYTMPAPEYDQDGKIAYLKIALNPETGQLTTRLELFEPPADGIIKSRFEIIDGEIFIVSKNAHNQDVRTRYIDTIEDEDQKTAFEAMVENGATYYDVRDPANDTDTELAYTRHTFDVATGEKSFEPILVAKEELETPDDQGDIENDESTHDHGDQNYGHHEYDFSADNPKIEPAPAPTGATEPIPAVPAVTPPERPITARPQPDGTISLFTHESSTPPSRSLPAEPLPVSGMRVTAEIPAWSMPAGALSTEAEAAPAETTLTTDAITMADAQSAAARPIRQLSNSKIATTKIPGIQSPARLEPGQPQTILRAHQPMQREQPQDQAEYRPPKPPINPEPNPTFAAPEIHAPKDPPKPGPLELPLPVHPSDEVEKWLSAPAAPTVTQAPRAHQPNSSPRPATPDEPSGPTGGRAVTLEHSVADPDSITNNTNEKSFAPEPAVDITSHLKPVDSEVPAAAAKTESAAAPAKAMRQETPSVNAVLPDIELPAATEQMMPASNAAVAEQTAEAPQAETTQIEQTVPTSNQVILAEAESIIFTPAAEPEPIQTAPQIQTEWRQSFGAPAIVAESSFWHEPAVITPATQTAIHKTVRPLKMAPNKPAAIPAAETATTPKSAHSSNANSVETFSPEAMPRRSVTAAISTDDSGLIIQFAGAERPGRRRSSRSARITADRIAA